MLSQVTREGKKGKKLGNSTEKICLPKLDMPGVPTDMEKGGSNDRVDGRNIQVIFIKYNHPIPPCSQSSKLYRQYNVN